VGNLRLSITMSLDGYVAGPAQSLENPLGVGGMELHEWLVPLKEFVTDGIEAALAQAKDAAAERDVWLAGGASTVNHYLAAGLVDEIDLSIAPVILGDGARLFDGLERGALQLEQVRAVDAPDVTHIKYRVG
jgi:dihydrofolate reductase